MSHTQWDIVRVRSNPGDRDEHPAVVISPPEHCAEGSRASLNVLYGTTRRPGRQPGSHEVPLNGADGLDHPTVFNCGYLYSVPRVKMSAALGRVAPERRRQIGRKIVATFRLPLRLAPA